MATEAEKHITHLVAAAQSREPEVSLAASLELAAVFNEQRNQLALEYGSLALEKAIRTGDRKRTALTHIELATFFLYTAMDYTEALRQCEKALRYTELSCVEARARTLRLMGVANYYLGRPAEAENKYRAALDLLLPLSEPTAKNRADIGNVYYNLAILNNTPENNNLRKEYLDLAFSVFAALDYRTGMAKCYDGWAIYHCIEGNYDQALANHRQALEIFNQLQDEGGISRTYNNMAQILLRIGDVEGGLDLFKKSLKIHRQYDAKYDMAVALINLGRTCFDLGREEQALQYLNEATEVLQHSESEPLLSELYDVYRSIYESRGEFEKAYKYQQLWIAYNNAIKIEENKKLMQRTLLQLETEQKERSAKLEREKQTLIQTYKHRLDAVNHELEQFVYAAAHDLREPLRSIKSFSELLERRLAHHEKKEIHEYTQFIQDGISQLDRVIHDLLVYSDSASTNEAYQDLEIMDLVQSSKSHLRSLLDQRNGAVIISRGGKITGPPSQIKLLFEHLIANGIIFNLQEFPVVEISYSVEQDFQKVSFSDNGIGIDKKYFQKIFGIFQRLNRRTEFPGSGIGLTICKKIVDNLQGRIEVSSIPGKGSVFTVYLPFKLVQ